MIRTALAFLCLPGLAFADPAFHLPIECTLGKNCYIQQYVDTDPSAGARDYTCASLSYDGHKGTDFALRSRADIALGVPVLAASDGVVTGVRDGVADTGYGPETDGKDCGNGVVIRHDNGWETQYCHLRRGSVSVSGRQQIRAGDILGYVGQSGRAEFPHLHFSVRHNGAVVDPFDVNPNTCGDTPEGQLWADPISYQPGGMIDAGFAPTLPLFSDIKQGKAIHDALSHNSPAIVLWAYGFGSRPGDLVELTILAPDGRQLFHNRAQLEKKQALYFRSGGKKRPETGWPTGQYYGRVVLVRSGKVMDRLEITLDIR